MRRAKNAEGLLLLVLVLALFSCSSSTAAFTPCAVVSDGMTYLADRGREFLAASDGEVTVLVNCSPTADWDRLCFTVGIRNDTENPYFLDDFQLECFSGDLAKGRWITAGLWDAEDYKRYSLRAANRSKINYVATGTLAVTKAGVGVSASPAESGQISFEYSYSPFSWLTALLSNIMDIATRNDINAEYLTFLEAHILSDAVILPGEVYAGVLYVVVDWDMPDRKLVFHSKNDRELEFLFSRLLL